MMMSIITLELMSSVKFLRWYIFKNNLSSRNIKKVKIKKTAGVLYCDEDGDNNGGKRFMNKEVLYENIKI